MFCSRARISTAEGRHHTNISEHVSEQRSDHTTSHYRASSFQDLLRLLGVNGVHFWCAIISGIKTNLQTHTHKCTHTRHPTCSLHMANVSHVFPYLGRFLPHRRHIKQHSVFHNFCQMTQCYVIPVLFQLESTAWHRGGQQLPGSCHSIIASDIISYLTLKTQTSAQQTVFFLSQTPLLD